MRSSRKGWLCVAGFMVCVSMVQAGAFTVSAAASLTDAFKDIGRAFEVENPGTRVRFNFGASDALVRQLAHGAPVDVLATADPESMDEAVAERLVDPRTRQDFARNTLAVVVPVDRETIPQALSDLGSAEVRRIALGQPESVPAGRYARSALEQAGYWPAIAGKAVYTHNVRQALDYVARGEVDAAFVYATDAAIRNDAVRTAFTVATGSPITYPIAVVAGGAREARGFLDYLLSPPGQLILARHGFLPP